MAILDDCILAKSNGGKTLTEESRSARKKKPVLLGFFFRSVNEE